MRKYIQITLIPDEVSGITSPVLMSHIIEKLHKAFIQFKDDKDRIPIGISFPEYDDQEPTLGKLVRMHGKEDILNKLNISGYINSLHDYVHITNPRPVPKPRLKGYVAYSRVRHGPSKDKLIRRCMKRHDMNFEEAKSKYINYQRQNFPKYPFILLHSKSTGDQKYPLYFKKIFLDQPGQDYFNTFGINPCAGVEYF